jgi:hypothetical protein
MVSLTWVTVGFVAATGLVILLARRSTARWEQARRAPVVTRTAATARETSPAASGFRAVTGAMARRGVAALRGRASRFPPVDALVRRLGRSPERGTTHGRPGRRLGSALRLPVDRLRGRQATDSRSRGRPDGEEADATVAPEGSAATPDVRRDGAPGQRLFRRRIPAPRRALAFLHRHEHPQEGRIPHETGDGSPTSRP